ncbi:unnamed protein product [Trichogramma brassicae]|uniref:Uncharacterized protein n=1 Tax=Trichogramma brassicae TaxID=86971 RepID=A0A6H5HZ25_9HYME|nr:unnamed protein product [Trichogramma brassicae]
MVHGRVVDLPVDEFRTAEHALRAAAALPVVSAGLRAQQEPRVVRALLHPRPHLLGQNFRRRVSRVARLGRRGLLPADRGDLLDTAAQHQLRPRLDRRLRLRGRRRLRARSHEERRLLPLPAHSVPGPDHPVRAIRPGDRKNLHALEPGQDEKNCPGPGSILLLAVRHAVLPALRLLQRAEISSGRGARARALGPLRFRLLLGPVLSQQVRGRVRTRVDGLSRRRRPSPGPAQVHRPHTPLLGHVETFRQRLVQIFTQVSSRGGFNSRFCI